MHPWCPVQMHIFHWMGMKTGFLKKVSKTPRSQIKTQTMNGHEDGQVGG